MIVSLAIPFERQSYKSCLKVSQLLICTTQTLPGLVLVGRCLSVCDFRRLTVAVRSSTDNVVGIFPRGSSSHRPRVVILRELD